MTSPKSTKPKASAKRRTATKKPTTGKSPPKPATGPGSKGKRTPLVGDCPDVFALIRSGNSLRQACEKLGFDHAETLRVIDADQTADGLAHHYARAREGNGEFYADQMKSVAAKTLLKQVAPDAARVAIDVYKWTAARMHPKAFGDKVQNEIVGKDGAPLQAGGPTVIVMYDNGRDTPATD